MRARFHEVLAAERMALEERAAVAAVHGEARPTVSCLSVSDGEVRLTRCVRDVMFRRTCKAIGVGFNKTLSAP